MAGKPSPDSPGLAQSDQSLQSESAFSETTLYEPVRNEKTASPQSEVASEHLAAEEWDHDELSPLLPTTSIDLSETVELPEETSPVFDSIQRYAQRSTSSPAPVPSQTLSAWDRETHSIPAATPPPAAGNFESVLNNDSPPDFSTFAVPGYGTPQLPTGNELPVNRYNNESRVRQVQYHQNPVAVHYDTPTIPAYPQQNTLPDTGSVYPASQAPQSQVPSGQLPSEQPYFPGTNFNVPVQSQNPPNFQQNQGMSPMPPSYYQQPEPNTRYNTPNSNGREEIPATFTNNTYRNPGTPQLASQGGYNTGQTNPQTVYPQGYGQSNPRNPSDIPPSHVPQYYNQPNYGTAVLPVNSLHR